MKLQEWFWSKVNKGNDDGCWEWQGYRNRGYGEVILKAHRLAWFLEHDEDPGEALVCHACDNPACCNPNHLWLGSKADNQADMVSKGRNTWVTHRGEDHYKTRLRELDVLEIRRLHATGGVSRSVLARMFRVGIKGIEAIVYRFSWQHI